MPLLDASGRTPALNPTITQVRAGPRTIVDRRRSLALFLAASLRRREQEEDAPGDLHAQHRNESERSGGPRLREYMRDVVVFLDARGRNVLRT
jgi:hypothetical protein